MSVFHFPNICLDRIGSLNFEQMTLSEKNCKWADCRRVSCTVKILSARPVSTNTFISSPALGSRVAVAQNSDRHFQLQTYKKSVKHKDNLEHLQGVQYQLMLDCGRKPKLFPLHVFPHLGNQKETASGGWTSFAVPMGCYRTACYNGVVFQQLGCWTPWNITKARYHSSCFATPVTHCLS